MVTKDYELDAKEKKWVSDLKRVLNRKPQGIEVVVASGNLSIYPTGTLEKHLESKMNGWGIGTDEKDNKELDIFSNKSLLPYSEGQ